MALDWSNERYVRVYTRDTTTWKLVDWRARTVLLHLFRKVDRAGVLDVGDDGIDGVAAVLELPPELVEAGMTQLVTRGTVVATGSAFVLPNFLEAQEAAASDKQRQREARDKRRALSLQTVTKRDDVSRNVMEPSQPVTRRHTASQPVTPSLAVPCRTEPDQPSCTRERESGTATPAALSLVPSEPVKPDPATRLATVAVDAINAATGRTFEPTSIATLRLARALVKAGVSEADALLVVKAKAAEWGDDPKMAGRVCPGTLLAAVNFARYLDEAKAGPVRAASQGNGHGRELRGARAGLAAVEILMAEERAAKAAEEQAT